MVGQRPYFLNQLEERIKQVSPLNVNHLKQNFKIQAHIKRKWEWFCWIGYSVRNAELGTIDDAIKDIKREVTVVASTTAVVLGRQRGCFCRAEQGKSFFLRVNQNTLVSNLTYLGEEWTILIKYWRFVCISKFLLVETAFFSLFLQRSNICDY